MIHRRVATEVREALRWQPAVALLGPRQVGKTTLAQQIGSEMNAVYFDLEDPDDRDKLRQARTLFDRYEDCLVILDEIHRLPDLLLSLRGAIDRGRGRGRRAGRFLILGSASLDVLRETGETLAGRIAYRELLPLDILEIPADPDDRPYAYRRPAAHQRRSGGPCPFDRAAGVPAPLVRPPNQRRSASRHSALHGISERLRSRIPEV